MATVETKAKGTPATAISPSAPLVLTLDEKVKALRGRGSVGIRPVEPMTDMFGIEPNTVSSKPPETLEMKPEELFIDGTYQRDLSRASMRLILKMINGWDWRKFKPPVVTLDDNGKYLIIDGQHTAIAAATHPDIKKIPVLFVSMPELAEQAAAFVSHNTARVRVTPLDLFHARLKGNDERAIDIYESAVKGGITINRYVPGAISTGAYEPNQTVAIGIMEQLHKQLGSMKFAEIMRVTGKCNFNPVRADHLRAIAILLFERESGEPDLSAELLVELIQSLNDADARQQAARMADTTHQTKGRALAQFYRNQYRQYFGKRK